MAKVNATITKVKDHSPEVLKLIDEKLNVAFQSIGAEAVTYAIGDVPVDTSRLKNSLTWATAKQTGGGNDKPMATPEDKSVYIGTNVEYAVYQEYGDYNHTVGKKHFLRDAAANHVDHYKAILEAALKSI